MEFKQWLIQERFSENPAVILLTPFFQKVKNYVLSNIRGDREHIEIKYPDNYSQYLNPHVIQHAGTVAPTVPHPQMQAQPQLQAAHYNPILENWSDFGGKGNVTYLRSQQRLANLDWSPEEIDTFKKTIEKKLRDISTEMGLMFEALVFFRLTDYHGLKIVGHNSRQTVDSQFMEHFQMMNNAIGRKATEQVVEFIKIQAEDMANAMIAKGKQILTKCQKINKVMFMGGKAKWIEIRNTTADLAIGCNFSNMLQYSMKFTSESLVRVADFSPLQIYYLISRKQPPAKYQQEIREFLTSYREHPTKDLEAEFKAYMIEIMHELFSGYTPKEFASLLNKILRGTRPDAPNIPAVSFYPKATTTAGYSDSLRKDFVIKKQKLRAKPDAEVSVDSVKSYVKLRYKRSGTEEDPGNRYGTYIIFEPTGGSVHVKANNLAS